MKQCYRENLGEAKKWIINELEACVDFWLKYGIDNINGGVYTCLSRNGEIYSTDKSVWMQGRCAWTFSYLCHIYGKRDEWINAAKSCLDFMETYCINRNANDRMYFTVTAEGKPLRQRRYCFSEGFYAIANAEYYGITGDNIYLKRAKKAYELIWQLNNGLIDDPVGLKEKTIAKTRKLKSLADPMIYLNITNILRRVDSGNFKLYDERASKCIDDIIKYHYKPELKCTLESVGLDGKAELHYTAGRVVNPGHDIECAWFLMERANLTNDYKLYGIAENIFSYAIEAGWDKEYGGLLYYTDCMGKPTEAYEHDMKLWWPHNEILIASLMAYRDTNKEYYLDWFLKTLEYCKTHFADDEFGEWYGYLRRDGLPTMPSPKGSTFKGPFHLPRMLIMTEQMINEILNKNGE